MCPCCFFHIFHCYESLVHFKSGSQTAGYDQGVQRWWTWEMRKENEDDEKLGSCHSFCLSAWERVWLGEESLSMPWGMAKAGCVGRRVAFASCWFTMVIGAVYVQVPLGLYLEGTMGVVRGVTSAWAKIILFINDIRRENIYQLDVSIQTLYQQKTH